MTELIVLGIFSILIVYVSWQLFIESIMWCLEPLFDCFANKETNQCENSHAGINNIETSDLENIPIQKVQMRMEDSTTITYVSKITLKKAEEEPQKLADGVWIYKDCIYSKKPTKKQINKALRNRIKRRF